ncbi:MAG: DNA topoisomerase IB [Jatrophihabitantaceae bacterium]
MTRPRSPARTIAQILELYDDAEACARAAGLRYASVEEPGIRRVRRGRGFSYRTPTGRAVSTAVRNRIDSLVIPPGWQNVWICSADDAHLMATGEDERGRTQYLYSERWRQFRDELNFYRLIDFGPRLSAVRADVELQLRRRTLDRELVLGVMLRVIDARGLRVGSESYAEENESYGLSTLMKRHVQVHGREVRFSFPAKSGKPAVVTLREPAVARVVSRLAQQRGRRLFTVGGKSIGAEDVNERLAELAGARVSAKDFRTWHGTRVAFAALRKHLPPAQDAETRVLDAVDAAAQFLGNTRTVAREHYVHPHVIGAYLDGSFPALLAARRPIRAARLDADERALVPFLRTLLARVLPS